MSAAFAAAFLLPVAAAALLRGAESPDSALGEAIVPVPTLGGMQWWSDEHFFHGWHIQRNVLSDHCRLLDPAGMRRAAGTYAQCRAALEKAKRRERLPSMQGSGVIVLHGLGRGHTMMTSLCAKLREGGRFTVFNVAYPSTRRPIAEHARSLARIVEDLDGIEEVHFVGHSMGNIVIRHYLADVATAGCPRRLGRFVMIGPPNTGSLAALALAENALFAALAGQPGQELGRGWPRLQERLVTPPCPFAIIAGGLENDSGFNPLLPGDDDGVVTVAGTRLAGAADFCVVPVLHSLLVEDPRVQERTQRFLEHGYLVSADARQPIEP